MFLYWVDIDLLARQCTFVDKVDIIFQWANSSAMVYMCSEAGNSSWERLSEVQESLCGYVVNDTFTGRDFTVTLWIQATADGWVEQRVFFTRLPL